MGTVAMGVKAMLDAIEAGVIEHTQDGFKWVNRYCTNCLSALPYQTVNGKGEIVANTFPRCSGHAF